MSSPASLEATIVNLCEREWRRRHRTSQTALGQPMPSFQQVAERVCPMRAILPELMTLLRDNHHRPMDELKPTIHRMVEERDFLDECGDPCVDEEQTRLIREYVDLLVSVLERVRCHHLNYGEWSSEPVPPLMFG